MNVQTMIQTLQAYWAEQNCLLLQSYDVEKGAGTMSPYTFFTCNRTRTLGSLLCRTITSS